MVTLKLIGFSEIEKTRFSAVLALAERNLRKNWSIADNATADFYLIKGRLFPQMEQHEILKRLPRQRCIFMCRPEDDLGIDGHQFHWGNEDLPSLRYLAEFFNQLTDNRATGPTSLPKTDPTPLSPNSAWFNPDEGFLGHLLATCQTPRAFSLANQATELMLCVDSEQKHYFSNVSLERLEPYFFATAELQIINLSATQLQTAITNAGLKAKPLTQLLWFTAYSCSQGRPIQGYQASDIVNLKRWPDLNLPGCKHLIKLAAFMHSNAVDLATVQAKTHIPVEQIFNFYNACQVVGLIGQSQQTDIHEKKINAEQKQLFAKIAKRLSQVERLSA